MKIMRGRVLNRIALFVCIALIDSQYYCLIAKKSLRS